ncbi:MAG TPA: hypothetical protein VLX92_23835 [Kofleriaceae bacterium]|nr:hypothetical protein [Kofleriaceae bacterium]
MTHRALVALALAGCGSSSTKPPPLVFGGDRPTNLQVPEPLDKHASYPLIMVLHGYGANGFVQEAYFGISALVKSGQAFVLAPDGTVDSTGAEFWNADPACCDFDNTGVDDSGYLGGLLDDVIAAYPEIDLDAIWIVGHSNGGYMAYRMACDHADVVTDIVVLAGAAASDPSTCNPELPVDVLHIHGTADTMVPYDPNAMASVTQWASHDGCDPTTTAGPAIDLDTGIPGAETQTETFDDCPPGSGVELWTIQGGMHIPTIDNTTFAPMIFQYMAAHRRLLPD